MHDNSNEIVFCKGGGCTAKLGPGALQKVLEKIPRKEDPNLLIGYDSSDDGAVYRVSDDLAIVQTLDFFPPMVEDPYTFGQIAAANAVSDIYAMGGQVKTALNIVCFPEHYDLNILGEIILGGTEKVHEAGGVVAGGHSIADADIKYGLSVMGTVHPEKIYSNTGGRPGDVLVLTKPLGVGIVSTAQRVKLASEEAMKAAIASMTTLNKYAAQLLGKYNIHGCTDVTGFGFLGHLSEMLGESGRACIYSSAIPYIPQAREYAEEFLLTAAAQKNRNHVGDQVEFRLDDFPMEEILFDPQTSGGLLVALPREDGLRLVEELYKGNLTGAVVGEIRESQERKIIVQ